MGPKLGRQFGDVAVARRGRSRVQGARLVVFPSVPLADNALPKGVFARSFLVAQRASPAVDSACFHRSGASTFGRTADANGPLAHSLGQSCRHNRGGAVATISRRAFRGCRRNGQHRGLTEEQDGVQRTSRWSMVGVKGNTCKRKESLAQRLVLGGVGVQEGGHITGVCFPVVEELGFSDQFTDP